MLQFKSVGELTTYLDLVREEGKSIGFVPTMGALHEGHISLIKRSKKENDVTVCSIFVNPLQFNNPEDLKRYPRNLEGDLKVLEGINADVVFHPAYDEVYPADIPVAPSLGYLENIMEGAFRPGHFKGVAVVVKRLFDIVRPRHAYFGLKDYQQFVVIKTLVKQNNLDVEVIGCPTTRDAKGLAMSSRNMRLSPEGKQAALVLIRSLEKARQLISSKPIPEIKKVISGMFTASANCRLEYFEVADADSLLAVEDIANHKVIIGCIAAYVEGVRLIDNLILIP